MTRLRDLTVAVLGTGTMGAPMARNLASAGARVRVWNRTRTRAEPLAEAGAEVCAGAGDAVAGADVVLTMLFDIDAVVAAVEACGPRLSAGTVWLQCSTVGVAGAERVHGLAAVHGLVLVDAPVLGTRAPAEAGALVALASGPAAARPVADAVLGPLCSRVMWVGEAGAGSRLKLACNAWVLTVVTGVAESLALARGLGLEPALVLDAVRGGALDAPYVQLKGAAMVDGETDAASFALAGAAKDAALVEAAAAAADLDLEVAPGVRRALERALAAGLGDADVAAVHEVLVVRGG